MSHSPSRQQPSAAGTKLTDLISPAGLTEIQEALAAAAAGAAVVVRHPDGRPVVAPAAPNRFTEQILKSPVVRDVWRPACEATRQSLAEARMARCDCLGCLTSIVASVSVGDDLIAMIEVGLRPSSELGPGDIRNLARALQIEEAELAETAKDARPWSESEMSSTEHSLNALICTMTRLCRRELMLQARVRELSTLSEVTTLLTSTLDLDEVLDLIVKTASERLGAKAATIRLLDREKGELVVSAVHNLSRVYLDKGPVRVAESRVDQEAIEKKVAYVADVRTDPRVIYRDEAHREGLRSALCAGLVTKNVPVGVLRVYTDVPREFTADEIRLFHAMANQAAVAIENARLYSVQREMRHLQTELRAAAEVQAHLLPTEAPEIPGVEIAMVNVPCEAVGGDLYDFVQIDETTWGITVADVSGKGIPAAIIMASVRSMIRGEVEDAYTVSKVVRTANRTLCRDAAESQFVTLFFATYDANTRRLRYTNAGHCEPILFRDQEYCLLDEGGLPLGLLPEERYEQAQAVLQPKDVVVAYTDGLTEAMNPEHGMFGRDRVMDVLHSCCDRSAQDILQAIRDATAAFCGSQERADDMTIVVMKLL